MNILTEQFINKNNDCEKKELNIKNYPDGVYFLKVIRDGNQQTIKFIKE